MQYIIATVNSSAYVSGDIGEPENDSIDHDGIIPPEIGKRSSEIRSNNLFVKALDHQSRDSSFQSIYTFFIL